MQRHEIVVSRAFAQESVVRLSSLLLSRRERTISARRSLGSAFFASFSPIALTRIEQEKSFGFELVDGSTFVAVDVRVDEGGNDTAWRLFQRLQGGRGSKMRILA